MSPEAQARAWRFLEKYCEDHKCRECVFNGKKECEIPDLETKSASVQAIGDAIRKIPWSDLLKLQKWDEHPHPEPDQTAKSDAGKVQLTLVPRQIIWDIAAVRMYGNQKYPEGGPENWRQVEVQRYKDALLRHLLKYLDDPLSVDEESGLLHRQHMECNMAFIAELEKDRQNDGKKEG